MSDVPCPRCGHSLNDVGIVVRESYICTYFPMSKKDGTVVMVRESRIRGVAPMEPDIYEEFEPYCGNCNEVILEYDWEWDEGDDED